MSNSSDKGFVMNNDIVLEDIRPNNREFFYKGFQVGKVDDDVAIIIDGAYLSHVTRSILKRAMDYRKLSLMFYENFPGLRHTNFLIMEYIKKDIKQDLSGREFKQGYSSIRGLLDYLRNNRYTVTSKTILLESDQVPYGSNIEIEQNMDVEITSALYKAARFAKHIVFIGGNEKYYGPLKDLHDQGHTITIVGARRPEQKISSNRVKYTADELRKIDNFVDLQDDFFGILFKPLREKIYADH